MATHFALVTDGTSDLTDALARQHQITIVPQHVIWGGETLKDRVDITIEDFYRRLATDPELPKTSQPSPAEFAAAFQRVRDETGAGAVLAPVISSELSGTYSSAQQAAKMVDFPVHAIDTRTASMAQGLIVLALADARDAGASAEEAVALAHRSIARSQVLFTVKTLEYLHRGGRIGGARRLLGTMLDIKPILHVQDGRIEALESVRTRKRALSRLVELLASLRDPARPLRIGVLHGDAPEEVEALAAEIKTRFQPQFITVGAICAAIGVHTGPGVIGFGMLQP